MAEYDYPLPEERIAKYPLANRTDSKLLHYKSGEITERKFTEIGDILPKDSLLVFNNTRVIRARIIMQKESGARIEIFCLEPHNPADYERAFAAKNSCEWCCIVGNLKRWKEGAISISFSDESNKKITLSAYLIERAKDGRNENIVRFEWNSEEREYRFGELLEKLGKIPIPPYLCRESESIDDTRYQTIYSKIEGSVAAPTAGLHFTQEIIEELKKDRNIESAEVTLHVGAGTFLPVKAENAAEHAMHTEHFEITLETVKRLLENHGKIIAVGTTSVRTLESLTALAFRVFNLGKNIENADLDRVVGQWELYSIPAEFTGEKALQILLEYLEKNNLKKIKASTQIMITPLGYKFRIVKSIVTNFHQPKSTLLLLVAAFIGENWKRVYNFALENNLRFLSYGDSSLLEL